jgi:phosphatidylinositol-3-phosphatase
LTSLTARFASIVVGAFVPVVLAVGAVMPASACTTRTPASGTHAATRPAAAATRSAATRSGAASVRPAQVPDYSHIVVVMEENHSYSQIIGSSQAPYINSLASEGALFTNSHAITHPSEPNYMAITSGSTYGLSSDVCPFTTSKANIGSELIAAKLSYADYSESMPSQGYEGCTNGEYARKHNPAANYTDLPSSVNQTFAQFPSSSAYASLPAVSFVDPNLLDDMHDGTIAAGDSWLKTNLGSYLTWATSHNSLLIVTWDENDGSPGNKIATIFAGAHVKAGKYSERVTHYRVLRTLEQAYGLKALGKSASTTPITDAFN